MIEPTPFVSVLCATYRRPRLMANAVACFLAQDYPCARRELLIADDGAGLTVDTAAAAAHGVTLFSTPQRFPSTASKYQFLAERARGDVLVVFDDDDVYLPRHLSAHAGCLATRAWSKPSIVGYRHGASGAFTTMPAKGRFHGSIALRRELLRSVGGWPTRPRADWSLRFMESLGRLEAPADPLEVVSEPTYIYRWQCSEAIQVSAIMASPSDEGWYERYAERLAAGPAQATRALSPAFDAETLALYQFHGVEKQPVALRLGGAWPDSSTR